MTIEEKQELLVLAALLPIKDKLLTYTEYDELITPIVGGSADVIKANLCRKNYMVEGLNYIDETKPEHWPFESRMRYGCRITDMGEKAYHDLKNKRSWEIAKEISFWVVVAATVITLYFTVIDHISCTSKPGIKQQPQGKDTPVLKAQPKTILSPKTK
jgi:hypothetical protein